ncbi:MAG: hypothetical protein RL154_1048 [Pseudomonadota bacterium]|jgi:quinol monooxygenase YgiN
MPIKVIAYISAKKDKIEFIKQEAVKLIEPTLKEVGCMEYQLFQDKDDDSNLIFIETWENEEILKKHLASKHLQDFIKSIEGFAIVSITKAELFAL